MSPDTRSSIFFTQVLGRVQLKIRGRQTLQKKIGYRQSNQKIARRCIFFYRSIARVQLYSACDDLRLLFLNF